MQIYGSLLENILMFKSNRQPISVISALTESDPNSYSPLLKESTKIKNDKGYSVAIEFLEAVYKKCDSPKDAVRIAKKIIGFKQKEKGVSKKECIEYVKRNFIDGLNMNVPENSELLLKYSELLPIDVNIDFLEDIINNKAYTDYSYLKLFFQLASLYSGQGEIDKALEVYRRAIHKLNLSEPWEYQKYYYSICYEISEMYFNYRPLGWEREFVFYWISSFVYMVCIDINPIMMGNYFSTKNLVDKGEFIQDEKFKKTIDELGKSAYMNKFYQVIIDFAFNELPLIRGVDKKCLNEKTYDQFHGEPNFAMEIMSFENVVDENGVTKFHPNGLPIERPFTETEKINNRIREIVNGIFKAY